MADMQREGLAATFDTVADTYHDVRPRYPERLFDDLVREADLSPNASLLEIGCGTGIATIPLAQRGFRILCLEPGPALATRASENLAGYPDVEVVPVSFEAWHTDRTFDLVYAATSWHWLDPQVRYSKAASLLEPEGSLAFFTAGHAFPEDADPFFFEIQPVYEALGEHDPSEAWPPPSPEELPDQAPEVVGSGFFEDVRVIRYVWEQRYTVDGYLALLNTFSGHIAMQPEKRAQLFSEIRRTIGQRADPTIRRHWFALLHVARRS